MQRGEEELRDMALHGAGIRVVIYKVRIEMQTVRVADIGRWNEPGKS